jgi:hypothetical protein
VSPADSGSPRAAHRQEHLHGPSSVPEPVLPAPAQPEHVPQAAPTPPSGLPVLPVLPASVPPPALSVPQVLQASGLPVLPASALQARLPSALPRVVPDL